MRRRSIWFNPRTRIGHVADARAQNLKRASSDWTSYVISDPSCVNESFKFTAECHATSLFAAASLVGSSASPTPRLCIAPFDGYLANVVSSRNERRHRHAYRGYGLPRGRHRREVFREAASPRLR